MARLFITTDRPKNFLAEWLETAKTLGYKEINKITAAPDIVSVNLFHGSIPGLEKIQLVFTTIANRDDTLICDAIDIEDISTKRQKEIENRMLTPLMAAYGETAGAIVGLSDGKKPAGTEIIFGD